MHKPVIINMDMMQLIHEYDLYYQAVIEFYYIICKVTTATWWIKRWYFWHIYSISFVIKSDNYSETIIIMKKFWYLPSQPTDLQKPSYKKNHNYKIKNTHYRTNSHHTAAATTNHTTHPHRTYKKSPPYKKESLLIMLNKI